MRCTQLWLVLEKHLSEQGLTEGFLNTRQSRCLMQRRERCAWTAEWKTGQRIMMVISSKPKQSHPLIPHSLSPPLFLLHPVSLTPKSSNTFHAPLCSQPHTNHILTWPFFFFSLTVLTELQFKTHFPLFCGEAVDMPFLICRRHDGCWRKHKLFMQISGCTSTCNVNSCTPDWPYFITGVSRSACLQLGTFVLMPACMPHTQRHTHPALWIRFFFFFFLISLIMCNSRSQTVYSSQAWRDALPWQTCETESVGWSRRR